jgi:hypothetical protein
MTGDEMELKYNGEPLVMNTLDSPAVEMTRPADYVLGIASRYMEFKTKRDQLVAEVSNMEKHMIELEAELVKAIREGRKVDPRIDVLQRGIHEAFSVALEEAQGHPRLT